MESPLTLLKGRALKTGKYSAGLFFDILDFIFPPECPLCGKIGVQNKIFCCNCAGRLKQKNHMHSFTSKADFPYVKEKLYFDQVLTAWDYGEEIEKAIHLIKYDKHRKPAYFLGRMLAEACLINQNISNEAVLVPVPLFHVRHRERGFNQSLLIARGISRVTGMPVLPKLLIRYRHTDTQTKLDARQRQKNVLNAFRVKTNKSIPPVVYLIDDVVTTGATVNACSFVLRNAGVKHVICLGLARPLK